MKKNRFAIALVLFLLPALFWNASLVHADDTTIKTLDVWKIVGGIIQPRATSSLIKIPSFGGTGTKCLHTDNSGNISTSTADCGSGSGGSATTTINSVNGPAFFLAAGTGLTLSSSSNIFTYANNGVLSWNGATGTIVFNPYAAGFITATSTSFATTSNIYAPGFITATSSQFYAQGFLTATSTAFATTSTIYAPGFITGTSTVFILSSASSSFLRVANNLSDLNSSSTARTNLGIIAGTGLTFDATNGFVNNGVLSVAGTANQVSTTAATGTITLSLPQRVDPNFTNFVLSGATTTNLKYTTASGTNLTSITATTTTLCLTGDVCRTTWPSSGGTPGGSNTQVQYNNGGAFGGDAKFTWSSSSLLFAIGNPSSNFSNAIISASNTVPSYLQINLQNKSAGATSTGEFVVTSDSGSDSNNFAAFGVNSSAYNSPAWSGQEGNSAFLYSSDRRLFIGSATTTSNGGIIFFTGGQTSSTWRGIIDSNGNWGIGTTTPSATLHVAGNAIITGTATTTTLCLSGDVCRTTWPSSGAGGGVGTTTAVTTGYFPYWGSATGLTGTSSIFQSGNNIGIGTSTPATLFTVATSSTKNFFSVTGAGNVGIATTTPSHQFIVASSSGAAVLDVDTSAGKDYILQVQNTSGTGIFQVSSTVIQVAGGANFNIATSAAPAINLEGNIWNDSTRQAFQGFINSIKQTVPGVLFSASTTATVVNTVSDTSAIPAGMGTTTLPANFWTTGKTLRIHGAGVYALPIGGGTATVKIKYGGITIATSTTSGLLGNAPLQRFRFDAYITARSTGSSGSVVTDGSVAYSSNAATNIYVEDPLNNNGSAVTIDTTASNLLDVTVAWDTAVSTKVATTTIATYEVLN